MFDRCVNDHDGSSRLCDSVDIDGWGVTVVPPPWLCDGNDGTAGAALPYPEHTVLLRKRSTSLWLRWALIRITLCQLGVFMHPCRLAFVYGMLEILLVGIRTTTWHVSTATGANGMHTISHRAPDEKLAFHLSPQDSILCSVCSREVPDESLDVT